MWPWDDEMQRFKALSHGDKLRVSRCVTRGEAPNDPRMAVAAVELAESYKRQGQAITVLMRWYPAFMIICWGYLSISRGDQLGLIFFVLAALGSIAHLLFNPGTRPKNMARSLEASRQVAASGR